MGYETFDIALNTIDVEDRRFAISDPLENIDHLAQSIAMVGLLHPPMVQAAGNSRYRIISGFRRIFALKKLGRTTTPVYMLSEDRSEQELALLAITENAHQRSLNLVEQARSAKLLCRTVSGPTRLSDCARMVELPQNQSMLGRISRLCDLPQEVQTAIGDGTIGYAVACELVDLTAAEAVQFARLFKEIPLGMNKQREVIERIREIAKREGCQTIEIFGRQWMREIIDSTDADRGGKARALRLCLKKKRFPQLSAYEKRWDTIVASMALPPNIRLAAPPAFEGQTFQVTIGFAELSQLSENKTILQKLADHHELGQLLKELQ